MNRSIDQFILQKKRRPATIFRYSGLPWAYSRIVRHLHRPVIDLASPPRGRRLNGVVSGRWEVMIP